MSWSKLSCLRTCPSHLCFLRQIIFNMLLASLAHTNTSSFATFSVQLILSILCYVHISNASNSFLFALVNVQVSAAYSATFQTVIFTIHFFCSQFNFPVNNFSCPWTMSCPLHFLLVCPGLSANSHSLQNGSISALKWLYARLKVEMRINYNWCW